MTLTKSKYYFEALDHYPYNLAECLEALNYALSYDPEDADALCLMGRIYSENLEKYEEAKFYFENALQCDVANLNIPKYFIKCLLDNEDLDEAEKLINYSLKIKGIDKCKILIQKSYFYEIKLEFNEAIKALDEAKVFAYDQGMLDFLKDRAKFVKAKMPKPKRQSKSKKETA